MAVIELGLVDQDGAEPVAEPGPRLLGRRELRRLLAALVTVFCVLTVTGSARPDPDGLRRLWSVPFESSADTFLFADNTVFVLARSTQATLTAYDLRSGAVRWSRSGFEDATWLTDIAAGVLMLPASYTTAQFTDADGAEGSREFSRETVAVDTATGRQLWRQSGELATTAGERVLLTEWDSTGAKAETLRVVRLRDGGTVWSYPAGGLASWITDTRPGTVAQRLVTVTAQGRTEVRDLADGAVLATATIPWGDGTAAENASGASLEGHQLYVDHTVGGRAIITAYDTETLRELWHIQPAERGATYGCGPVLCLNSTDETTAYDRRTGELRWRIPGPANGFPLLDTLLLVDDDETGTRHHLVDAATGRQLADLGTAVPVWNQDLDRTPYLVGSPTQPADFMLVSHLNEDTGEVLLRGTIPPVVDYGCQSDGALLVCVTLDGRLAVTDVG